MSGAIIGDIVGSIYEWNNIKTKDFQLFQTNCFFTDDTIMTIATTETLLNGGIADNFIDSYKKWGKFIQQPVMGYFSKNGLIRLSENLTIVGEMELQ
jgi:ADP-ribosylglycohydrolase